MKVLVIGATRGVGLRFVERALDRGHSVTALARHPQQLALSHQQLTVVPGDVRDAARVKAAIAGHDAVCCALGMAPTRDPVTLFSEGARNILAAMRESHVRRLICVTGIGAGSSRNHGGFLYDRIVQPFLLKTMYEDKDRQEELIRASDVEWVIVRPGFLTDGDARGGYRALTDLNGIRAGKISRADVADFMLEQLTSDEYLCQAPLLMY